MKPIKLARYSSISKESRTATTELRDNISLMIDGNILRIDWKNNHKLAHLETIILNQMTVIIWMHNEKELWFKYEDRIDLTLNKKRFQIGFKSKEDLNKCMEGLERLDITVNRPGFDLSQMTQTQQSEEFRFQSSIQSSQVPEISPVPEISQKIEERANHDKCVIEYILGKRRVEGRLEYLVKW
jgi:hypothetical protein